MRSPVERAWDRALALAPAEEVEELHLLCELAQTQEPESLAFLETTLKVWELRERIMYRESPTLAAFDRTQRCLLLRGLEWLTEEAKRDYEGWYESPVPRYSPGLPAAQVGHEMYEEIMRLERRYYGLSTATINRARAVREGLEPITDLAEAERLLGEVLTAIDAPDSTDRVLRIVERA